MLLDDGREDVDDANDVIEFDSMCDPKLSEAVGLKVAV